MDIKQHFLFCFVRSRIRILNVYATCMRFALLSRVSISIRFVYFILHFHFKHNSIKFANCFHLVFLFFFLFSFDFDCVWCVGIALQKVNGCNGILRRDRVTFVHKNYIFCILFRGIDSYTEIKWRNGESAIDLIDHLTFRFCY